MNRIYNRLPRLVLPRDLPPCFVTLYILYLRYTFRTAIYNRTFSLRQASLIVDGNSSRSIKLIAIIQPGYSIRRKQTSTPSALVFYCYGTARDTRYARRVAFLSLFNITRQIVYPPRLPLYRFSLSRISVKLSSNPLKSSTTAIHSYQFYESNTCLSSVRI